MRPLTIGDISVSRLVELEAPTFPVNVFFPSLDPAAVQAERAWLEPRFVDWASQVLIFSFHSFAVRTPRHTIIVDTCIGNDKDRPGFEGMHRRQGNYLAALAELGVRPENVDFVLCTHLHLDHIGWNTRLVDGRWVPTFPKAAYIFARTEYDHWHAFAEKKFEIPMPPEMAQVFRGAFADSVVPVVSSGQARLVDGIYEIDECCRIEPAPGHTPGNALVRLSSRGREAVLSGDVMHHPLQIVHPNLSSAFCADPALASQTRIRLVEESADRDVVVLPAHFPTPTAGRIVSNNGRFSFAFRE